MKQRDEAFYAEGVRQFQPRVASTLGHKYQRIVTLKALANGLAGVRLELESQG
jgi:hypothetical protein